MYHVQCLILIFQKLDNVDSLLSVGRVCACWRKASLSPVLWSKTRRFQEICTFAPCSRDLVLLEKQEHKEEKLLLKIKALESRIVKNGVSKTELIRSSVIHNPLYKSRENIALASSSGWMDVCFLGAMVNFMADYCINVISHSVIYWRHAHESESETKLGIVEISEGVRLEAEKEKTDAMKDVLKVYGSYGGENDENWTPNDDSSEEEESAEDDEEEIEEAEAIDEDDQEDIWIDIFNFVDLKVSDTKKIEYEDGLVRSIWKKHKNWSPCIDLETFVRFLLAPVVLEKFPFMSISRSALDTLRAAAEDVLMRLLLKNIHIRSHAFQDLCWMKQYGGPLRPSIMKVLRETFESKEQTFEERRKHYAPNLRCQRCERKQMECSVCGSRQCPLCSSTAKAGRCYRCSAIFMTCCFGVCCSTCRHNYCSGCLKKEKDLPEKCSSNKCYEKRTEFVVEEWEELE